MKCHSIDQYKPLGVSFTPREEGEHLIAVKQNGQVIPKSPFRIKVDKSQVRFNCFLITGIYLMTAKDVKFVAGRECVESCC